MFTTGQMKKPRKGGDKKKKKGSEEHGAELC